MPSSRLMEIEGDSFIETIAYHPKLRKITSENFINSVLQNRIKYFAKFDGARLILHKKCLGKNIFYFKTGENDKK